MPEGWEMDPQISCLIRDHFSWGLGYFTIQTKLKWTKKIKALFLSLTKSDGKGFWRLRAYFWDTFLTHMCPNLAWGVEIFKSKTALILMPGLRIDPRHLVNNVCLYLDLTLSPSAQRNSTVARPITLICTETKKYWEGRKFWISLWRWTQNHRVGVWQGP